MSNYNRSYSNNNSSHNGIVKGGNSNFGNSQYDAQSSSAAGYHQQREEDYHPLQQHQQQQNQQEQYADEQYGEKHQDPSRPKRRNLNPVKAVVGGVSQGTQAVVGGVSQGANAVRGGISTVEKGVTQVGNKLTKVPGVSHGVSFFSDYRKFMDRGNVVDLAVAVVIGAAFTAIVTSLVTDIITPFIALASGKNLEENFIILRRSHNATADALGIPSTRQRAKEDGDVTWNWGNFVQTIINFIVVSGCVFLFVKVYQVSRNKKTEVTEKKCDYCLKSIPLNSVRCPNCTTWLDWDACTKVANMERVAASGGPRGTESPFVDQPNGTQNYQNAQQASLGRF